MQSNTMQYNKYWPNELVMNICISTSATWLRDSLPDRSISLIPKFYIPDAVVLPKRFPTYPR